ncbi:MAG: peptide-methionine (S)-S-oxide reductase MsrA [Spirochaetales bacterium]|nr:MAG: peptide-methionine (S)-S-oxide reductase MsrA [Spirochaetales bacterium]
MDRTSLSSLVLGGGCFWCLEAAFEIVPGVKAVESGYAGGARADPTYEQVSSGRTGHAEVVRIFFNPLEVTYEQLLDLFFRIHDPTTEDRQGADAGPQYRSIILYTGEDQMAAAQKAIEAASKVYRDPVVTDLEPLKEFWLAEDYHQDFFSKNPEYGYCRIVVAPKVEKARQFVDKLE